MKAVILADGRGARISEGSHLRPKPMIEIGCQPISLAHDEAVRAAEDRRFLSDEYVNGKLLMTSSPRGYLRRIAG